MTDVICELVKNNLSEVRCENSEIKIEKYDSGGANYLSTLYKVVITTDDEQHLFAKVASFNDSMRESADWIFHTEQYVYMKLAKVYDDIQEYHAVPAHHRFVFPKLFGCNTEKGTETVVIEDLYARGYISYNRFQPMDWEYASASVQTLARFHALSFAYEKEKPKEFQRVAEEMRSRLDPDTEPLSQIWGPMVTDALSVLEGEKRVRATKLLYDKQLLINYVKPVQKIVLVHGDYRLSNLLFKKQDARLEAIAVDYQVFHAGCAARDLLYLISLGSDRQFRANHFRKLIDYYYEQLALSLKRLSLDIVEVYPRETFDLELNKVLPDMLVNAVLILPAVTVDPDSARTVTESFTDFLMAPSDLFKKRFSEIIDDCIEWGII